MAKTIKRGSRFRMAVFFRVGKSGLADYFFFLEGYGILALAVPFFQPETEIFCRTVRAAGRPGGRDVAGKDRMGPDGQKER